MVLEVRDPWSVEEVEWVFCENISRFAPIEFAQDFRAIVSPPFIKRFIFNNESKEAREWMGQTELMYFMDPNNVVYTPQAALSW